MRYPITPYKVTMLLKHPVYAYSIYIHIYTRVRTIYRERKLVHKRRMKRGVFWGASEAKKGWVVGGGELGVVLLNFFSCHNFVIVFGKKILLRGCEKEEKGATVEGFGGGGGEEEKLRKTKSRLRRRSCAFIAK